MKIWSAGERQLTGPGKGVLGFVDVGVGGDVGHEDRNAYSGLRGWYRRLQQGYCILMDISGGKSLFGLESRLLLICSR